MLYAVIDSSATSLTDKLIGYHEKRKVVAQYYYSLKQLKNSTKYKFVKCKSKVIESIPDYYEYYLVRFGRNYIPSKYFSFAKEDLQTVIFEYKHTMEILTRIFEFEDLSKHDRNTIERSLFILQNLVDKEMDCVADPYELKEMERMYSEFKEKTFWPEFINDNEWVPFFEVDNLD